MRMEHSYFCNTLDASRRPFLGQALLRPRLFPESLSIVSSRIFCRGSGSNGRRNGSGGSGLGKAKENVWSQENEMACCAEEKKMVKGRGVRERGRRRAVGKRRGANSRVFVSAPMLTKVDAVLQTQEPFVQPVWNTFASNVCGIWKGVGAVFSPSTAEMEPIAIGKKNENLYDCYVLSSCVQNLDCSGSHLPQIYRKTNWVTLNPFGENKYNSIGDQNPKDRNGIMGRKLPSYEYFDFSSSDVLEEEFLTMEPGLVFFEDGSFSRGPIEIPLSDESKYFLSPTFKFEQCLVQGCHKRLRIVYTIEFSDGGSHIQIIRVVVFEEEWVRPSNLDDDGRDAKLDLETFSQRKRTQQSELAGSWIVFEKNAAPIFNEDNDDESGNKGSPTYAYLCTETSVKRNLPDNKQVYFGKEEMLETVLWLPGGVTGYVNVNNDGILCIGVGWFSEDGINLVMERDYGIDGKLVEVRWKSELKKK